jgi:anti-sigma factor RsiW
MMATTLNGDFDDALLVAYVDGELDAKRAATVAARIAADPALEAKAAAMRRSAVRAREAFADAHLGPVPAGLTALLAEGGNVAPIAPRATGRRQWTYRRLALPAAACLVFLVVGFGSGRMLDVGYDERLHLAAADIDGPAEAAYLGALARALEEGEAGAHVAYSHEASATDGTVIVLGEVATATLPLCREFRHESRRGGVSLVETGLACRTADGGWQLLTVPAER